MSVDHCDTVMPSTAMIGRLILCSLMFLSGALCSLKPVSTLKLLTGFSDRQWRGLEGHSAATAVRGMKRTVRTLQLIGAVVALISIVDIIRQFLRLCF